MDYKTKQAVMARLNAARKKAGMRYEDLARATGISFGTIPGYFSGYTFPPPERLRAMAAAVGVSVEFLMGERAKKAVEAVWKGKNISQHLIQKKRSKSP